MSYSVDFQPGQLVQPRFRDVGYGPESEYGYSYPDATSKDYTEIPYGTIGVFIGTEPRYSGEVYVVLFGDKLLEGFWDLVPVEFK